VVVQSESTPTSSSDLLLTQVQEDVAAARADLAAVQERGHERVLP